MDPCRVPRALHWYAPREPQYFPRILSLRPSPPHSLLLLDDSVGLAILSVAGPMQYIRNRKLIQEKHPAS